MMHDPIRGDLPHHQMYTPDVSVEEDFLGVPNRRGSRNIIGKAFVPRPMSVMSPTERTVVGDGPPLGPVSRRDSRLMSAASDAPSVSVLFCFIRG